MTSRTGPLPRPLPRLIRMGTKLRTAALLMALLGGLSFAEPSALAQSSRKKQQEVVTEPPTPRRADKPPIIWNFMVALVIVGAAFGANMIPSKRGHQD